MEKRQQLHQELLDILGSPNVYYQPPPTVQMKYPCIVYHRSTGDTTFADNYPYMFTVRYQLTYITRNADDPMVEKLARAFPSIRYDRHFTSDNLNHETFDLYY